MSIKLPSDNRCTGCASCANICPNKAIEMLENEQGFVQPVINESKCIKCGLCLKTCPVINVYVSHNKKRPIVYGARCKNKSIRFKSTSGGVFATIAKKILNSNGIAVGAIYKTPYYVKHAISYNISELEQLLQSKYVQSDIGYIYREISDNLKNGKKVLFCGTPCQVSGLYSFLKKRPKNLLTCDFICYGVNSPKAYRSWLNEISQEYGEIKRVWFKYKAKGWYNSPMCTRIELCDKKELILDNDSNYYMAGYIYDALYIRPSCSECEFKGLPRNSDITLGDFWGIDKKLDDDKGTSVVILNSEKGENFFENIKNELDFWKTDLDGVIKGNHMINEYVNISDKSYEFLDKLDKIPFSTLYKRYSTNNKDNIKW